MYINNKQFQVRKKVEDTLHASALRILENTVVSKGPNILRNLIFKILLVRKCSDLARKVCRPFSSRYSLSRPYSAWLEEVIWFAWLFRTLECELRSARIIISRGIWHLCLFLEIPLLSAAIGHAKYLDLLLPTRGRKTLRHFAYPLKALRSGILPKWKKCQNPQILRNLTLF